MNIAIRGAGKFGQYIYGEIKDNIKYNIKYFIDNNPDLWGKRIDNVPIVSTEDIINVLSNDVDYVLVAFVNSIENYKDIVKGSSIKYGFVKNRVLTAGIHLKNDLRTDSNIVWSDSEYLDKPILGSLETNIVDYCNLNCRGCSHFSNIFSRKEKGILFETFCRDLQYIAEHIYINNFYLLGGEALLNENINDYIRTSREALPYSDIQLVSNGLLIPRQKKDFFECCVENDVVISISGYKPTLLMQQNIKDILEKHQVLYEFRDEVGHFSKNLNLSGDVDIYEALAGCHQSGCHFLREGRIYKCPFQALGNVFFEHYGIDIRLKGGVDIYQKDLDWENLVDFLHNQPVDECRYCGKEEHMEWKVTNTPSLNDWVVKGVE